MKPTNWPGFEGIAPSVDPQWVEDFVLEQRLRDVPGVRIGDALATIESHVRESGESAQEAFGDPTEYARAFPTGSERELRRVDMLHIILGLAGMLLLSRAFSEWVLDRPVEISGGDLVSTGLLAALMGIFLAAPAAALRVVLRRRWLAIVIPVVLVGSLVGVQLAWETTLFTLPLVPVVVVGALALLTSSVVVYFTYRDSAIPAPGRPAPTGAQRRRWTITLLYPGITVGLLLMSSVPAWFA